MGKLFLDGDVPLEVGHIGGGGPRSVSTNPATRRAPSSARAPRDPEDRRLYLGTVPQAKVIDATYTEPTPSNLPAVRREIAPGVTLVAQGGVEVGIAQVGTEDKPMWLVTPGPRKEDGTHDAAGVIPLLIMAAVKIVKKADKKNKAKKAAEAGAPPGEPAATPKTHPKWNRFLQAFNPSQLHKAPEVISGMFGGDEEEIIVGGGDLQHVGYDDLGAILIDTDGVRVQV